DYKVTGVQTCALPILVAEGGLLILSLLAAGLVIRFAAWRIERGWRDEGRSERAERIERVIGKPVFGRGLLRKWLDRRLTRNPVGWLEHRTWNARLVRWGWLGAVGMIFA